MSKLRGIRRAAVYVTAILALTLMLIPPGVWKHRENDAVYEGFDRTLIYTDSRGFTAKTRSDLEVDGAIHLNRDALTLTALPRSRPTAQLLTTPLGSFSIDVDVTPIEVSVGSTTLEIAVWSPRKAAGLFLVFGPAPLQDIIFTARRDGVSSQTLLGGRQVAWQRLGNYEVGLSYQVRLALDKDRGEVRVWVVGENSPEGVDSVLRLRGGPENPDYADVSSEQFEVVGGQRYEFGGLVKRVAGNDSYKIAIHWYDQNGRLLSVANDWRRVMEGTSWTETVFTAQAPVEATKAAMILGSGNGTQLLFADLFVRPEGSTANILPGGDTLLPSSGWAFATPEGSLDVFEPQRFVSSARLDLDRIPELKDSLRLSVTASSQSDNAASSVTLSNYRLTLPHQTWQVTETHDTRAMLALLVLSALSLLIVGARIVEWLKDRYRELLAPGRTVSFSVRRGVGLAGALGVVFAANLLLFKAGHLPFDMISQRVWSHVASSGIGELYHMPNTVSLAAVWGGAPFHEAVFPYEPVMGYLFWLAGWISRILFGAVIANGLEAAPVDTLLKLVNVSFALGNGYLLYRLLQGFGVGRRVASLSAALLVFNPAVWFSTSIWGQNHMVSTLFMLAALRFAQKDNARMSWFLLAVAALTRPQMLAVGALAGIFLLRKFSWRRSLEAVCTTVVAIFLLMVPFMVSLGPSVPADVLKNQFFVQEGGGNEPELTTVSLGAYSLWPGITGFTEDASGTDRFGVSSQDRLMGPFSYQGLSMFASLAVIAGLGTVLAIRGRKESVAYPVIACGTAAFLMAKTGLSPSHFVLALPLLVLLRKWMAKWPYRLMVVIWSLTTLISMYGTVSEAITGQRHFAPFLHRDNNPLTRLVDAAYASDAFMTIAVLANLAVVLVVLVYAVANLRKKERHDPPSESLRGSWDRISIPERGDFVWHPST